MNDRLNEGESGAATGSTSGLLRQSAQTRSTRRNMLRRGGVVAAASVAGLTLLDQRRAEAATGGGFVLGNNNDANNPTQLHVTTSGNTLVPLFHIDGTGLSGTSTSMIVDGPGSLQGIALKVNGNSGGTGIITSAAKGPQGTTGLALAASGSNGADAIHAASDKGSGVAGSSTSGKGVTGASKSNTGVAGSSVSGVGVSGKGKRGGVFSGAVAAIQLPPHAGSHPTSGMKGDLFVDHNTNLWFCRGGTTWVKLA
jgi:hypothetical protein